MRSPAGRPGESNARSVEDATVLVLVPARGGSKGIPGKNLRQVAGKSLVEWAVRVGQAVTDLVVVSSDDSAILEEARRFGSHALPRAAELASDTATTLDVLRSVLPGFPVADLIVVLQPTSPLRDLVDVQRCLARLHEAPSVATVTPLEHPVEWILELDERDRLRFSVDAHDLGPRQLAATRFRLNGAVYCARRDWLEAGNPLVSAETIGVPMPPERSIDIDTPFDLTIAELMAGRLRQDHAGDE